MPIIDEKGRIFGIVNIIDFAILSIVLVLVLSLLLYSKYPLHIKEHVDTTFQIAFINIPEAIAQEVFLPGTPLIANYAKQDTAIITDVQDVVLYQYDTEGRYNITTYIVTVNASLEIDAEGDLLFNGNDVAPGNFHDFQIGSSYYGGQIWRVNYTHSMQTIEVSLKLADEYKQYANTTGAEDRVFDMLGNEVGTVITREQDILTLSLNADVYDGAFYVSEMPIGQYSYLYFMSSNTPYKGTIINSSTFGDAS